MTQPDPTAIPQRIYLLGMMGVGKSTIGKKISSLLRYKFIDLDKEIERQEGKTITEIFETSGEAYFRDIESRVLHSITDTYIIIATGGGTPCYYNHMQYMNAEGTSVYLKANPGLIFQRISPHIYKRPLLKGMNDEDLMGFIKQKINEREPYYMQANYVFDIPLSSAETIVKSIGLKSTGASGIPSLPDSVDNV